MPRPHRARRPLRKSQLIGVRMVRAARAALGTLAWKIGPSRHSLLPRGDQLGPGRGLQPERWTLLS